jgi:dethiobiotin synthase
LRRGLFVTGTDTGVGKTITSAVLMHQYRAIEPVRYWKPIQTGIEQDDDTAVVRLLGQCREDELLEAGVRLRRPLSPHLSARIAGVALSVEATARIAEQASFDGWSIVEGAGGVLVPLNDRELMADLMTALDLPVVVVARSTIGTINHTLLTLEALRARGLAIAGVVMVGEPSPENRMAIEAHGGVTTLGELPRLDPLSADDLKRVATGWKKYVPRLP